MFSLSQTRLDEHENLITCIIFANQEPVVVESIGEQLSAKIVCIKPDVNHKVFIPASGAEILYLDGVKLHQHFKDFESLSNKWQAIPSAFYDSDHDTLEAFKRYLDRENSAPNYPIINVIEELYQNPFSRMTQSELANRLCLERTQALKYFKSVTGQTFRRFKKWSAMITVTSDVLNGQIISHAGLDAGFSDAAHATRSAKELFGLTPTNGVNCLKRLTTLHRTI